MRTWPAVGATALVAVVAALPFARTGARVRSGYELVRTAESAGVVEGAAGTIAVVALALLPLLAAGALAAASLRRPAIVATLAIVAGFVGAAVGTAVVRSAAVEPLGGARAAVLVGLTSLTAGAIAATDAGRRP